MFLTMDFLHYINYITPGGDLLWALLLMIVLLHDTGSFTSSLSTHSGVAKKLESDITENPKTLLPENISSHKQRARDIIFTERFLYASSHALSHLRSITSL